MEYLTGFLDALAGLDPLVVGVATCLFLAVETSAFIGLVVPGDTVALVAGSTVTAPVEFATLVGLAVLGSLLGESGGYLIGRRFGARVRYGRTGRWIGERRWERAERFLNGGAGGWALVSARYVPIVHALVPVLAGTLRMPYRRFIAWEAGGALIWSLTYLGIGAIVGAALREHGHRLGYVGSAVILLLIGGVAVLVRWRRRGADRIEAAAEPAGSSGGAPSQATPKRHPAEAAGARAAGGD
jgi:membrane-associated protein